MEHASTLTANFIYNDRAEGPADTGGGWRFYLPAGEGQSGAQSLTLTERDFDALGRPSVIRLTLEGVRQAPAIG